MRTAFESAMTANDTLLAVSKRVKTVSAALRQDDYARARLRRIIHPERSSSMTVTGIAVRLLLLTLVSDPRCSWDVVPPA